MNAHGGWNVMSEGANETHRVPAFTHMVQSLPPFLPFLGSIVCVVYTTNTI